MKLLFILLFSFNIYAQYFNIDSQIKLNTGVSALTWYQEVGYRRSYTGIVFDTSMIIDEDRSFQYGLNIDMEFEKRLSFSPGLFLKTEKKLNNKYLLFGIAGFNYMVTPETIFSFRVGIGFNYVLLSYLELILEINIKPSLFGSGVNGKPFTDIKLLFGVGFIF
jgi:hypothetical protein